MVILYIIVHHLAPDNNFSHMFAYSMPQLIIHARVVFHSCHPGTVIIGQVVMVVLG